jgi:hypothetical protein
MGLFGKRGHIDRSTGQNKRVKVTQRDHTAQTPERWGGRIKDRAASAKKMKVERALRRRAR